VSRWCPGADGIGSMERCQAVLQLPRGQFFLYPDFEQIF
jgi:hypothetical protein